MILTHNWGKTDTTLRRGTGRVIAEKFVPQSLSSGSAVSPTPLEVFPPGLSFRASPVVRRFINRQDKTQFLVYTDDACVNNGTIPLDLEFLSDRFFDFSTRKDKIDLPNPTQGCGWIHLEKKGPFDDPSAQTSNRAELRAVMAALGFRIWSGEGFTSMVIATDSEYVVEGATKWMTNWLNNNWRTRNGPVKNKDLWEALLGEFERHHEHGLKILFWRIPRELNTVADQWAKFAALDEKASEKFRDITGLLV